MKRPIAAVSVLIATAVLTAGVRTASAQANAERHTYGGKSWLTVSGVPSSTTAACASSGYVNVVTVTRALLRKQPNVNSTKLDVAFVGQLIDLFCWWGTARWRLHLVLGTSTGQPVPRLHAGRVDQVGHLSSVFPTLTTEYVHQARLGR